jgi:hypothetical protein
LAGADGAGEDEGDGAAGEEPHAAQRPQAINTPMMCRIQPTLGKHAAREREVVRA